MTAELPSEEELARLIPAFYGRVREDPLIGPLFNEAIDDWPHHLERLTAFWSSVMLTSGRYKGSPMQAHLRHGEAIRPEMFARWLALWHEVTDAMLSPAAAQAMQGKADLIGESLQLALFYRPGRKVPA